MQNFDVSGSMAAEGEENPPVVQTSQRIYQRDKKRLAIRLEDAFWKQLEDCAREEKRNFSDLLFEVIEGAGERTNRTAILRLYCLLWLRKRLAKSERSTGGLDIQTALSACPSPCVIMTKEKAIVAYNTAFAENIVSRLTKTGKGADKDSPLTFKLDTPLEEIHRELLRGKVRYRDTRAAFVKQDKIIRVGARFCLLESDKGPNTSLLCYLMAG